MIEGVGLIQQERQHQLGPEGRTRDSDISTNVHDELALAAVHYALPPSSAIDVWPGAWDRTWDKKAKHDRIRQLAIAGALLAAEIDRLQALQMLQGRALEDAQGVAYPQGLYYTLVDGPYHGMIIDPRELKPVIFIAPAGAHSMVYQTPVAQPGVPCAMYVLNPYQRTYKFCSNVQM